MAKFFLHLRDGTDELLDPEGQEFADMEALRRHVMITVRDLMAGDVRNGLIDFRYHIDAQDEAGKVVYSLPFRHAISVIPEIA